MRYQVSAFRYDGNIPGTGVTPFVVAVGQYSDYGKQLSYIAHGDDFSKDRVLTVDSFELLQTVIGTLTSSIASTISLEGEAPYGLSELKSNFL